MSDTPTASDASADADDVIALSGLLDNELPPDRAAALRLRIAADPILRARWEALRQDDARWRAMARSAQAPVDVLAAAPRIDVAPTIWVAMLVIALTVGRFLPKLMPLDILTALLLHGLLLAVALAVIALGARRLGSAA